LLVLGTLSAGTAIVAAEASVFFALLLGLYAASPWLLLAVSRNLIGGRRGKVLLATLIVIAVGIYSTVLTSDSSTAILGAVFVTIYQWMAIGCAFVMKQPRHSP
jgi:hypothetical protein